VYRKLTARLDEMRPILKQASAFLRGVDLLGRWRLRLWFRWFEALFRVQHQVTFVGEAAFADLAGDRQLDVFALEVAVQPVQRAKGRRAVVAPESKLCINCQPTSRNWQRIGITGTLRMRN